MTYDKAKSRTELLQDVQREIDQAYADAEAKHPKLMELGREYRDETVVCRTCGSATAHASRICAACRKEGRTPLRVLQNWLVNVFVGLVLGWLLYISLR